MIMQDKLERERSNAKNAVEEYAYENREKIYDQFGAFMTEQVKPPGVSSSDSSWEAIGAWGSTDDPVAL